MEETLKKLDINALSPLRRSINYTNSSRWRGKS